MFLETICIQHGVAQNVQGHVERMRETARHFGFAAPALPQLKPLIPIDLTHTKVKCRVLYHTKIEEITFSAYTPKLIQSLQLVEASPDYAFKFSDRNALNTLLAQKGHCDEILIARNGCITDTSYSNVALRKGNTFFTPDTYLLNGTKRQQLLRENNIVEKRITIQHLNEFEEVYLINAMLDIADAVKLPIEAIV